MGDGFSFDLNPWLAVLAVTLAAVARWWSLRAVLGVEPMPGTPAQMASFAGAERRKWGAVIARAGVKLD